jgi:hypothetical protein
VLMFSEIPSNLIAILRVRLTVMPV